MKNTKKPRRARKEYTTRKPWQEISEGGGCYERGSLYDYFHTLKDPRHAKGKRHHQGRQISTDFQEAKQVSYGHGRIETRIIQTSTMLNDYLDWPGLQQVYKLERRFSWFRNGEIYKTTIEIEVGVTSLSRKKASPAHLMDIRRQYWLIETGLHYRRGVTFKEDATRMTIGSAGRILASIHNLLIGLIKKAGYTNAVKPAVILKAISGGFFAPDDRLFSLS